MNDLFDYPASPGYKEHDTSRAAAESMKGNVHRLRSRCLEALLQRPQTADEVAAYIGETVLATRPRITELQKLGLIEDTGERRANASGRSAKSWRVK